MCPSSTHWSKKDRMRWITCWTGWMATNLTMSCCWRKNLHLMSYSPRFRLLLIHSKIHRQAKFWWCLKKIEESPLEAALQETGRLCLWNPRIAPVIFSEIWSSRSIKTRSWLIRCQQPACWRLLHGSAKELRVRDLKDSRTSSRFKKLM